MATRSCIGVQCGNKIVAIYAHWDGYPAHMGRHLYEYHNSLSHAIALIARGDLSSIAPTLEESKFYNESHGAGNDFKEFNSVEDFYSHYQDCGCEYSYLYSTKTDAWSVSKMRGSVPAFDLLANELEGQTA